MGVLIEVVHHAKEAGDRNHIGRGSPPGDHVIDPTYHGLLERFKLIFVSHDEDLGISSQFCNAVTLVDPVIFGVEVFQNHRKDLWVVIWHVDMLFDPFFEVRLTQCAENRRL